MFGISLVLERETLSDLFFITQILCKQVEGWEGKNNLAENLIPNRNQVSATFEVP